MMEPAFYFALLIGVLAPWIGFCIGFVAAGRGRTHTIQGQDRCRRKYVRRHLVHIAVFYAGIILCFTATQDAGLGVGVQMTSCVILALGVALGAWLWRRGVRTMPDRGRCESCGYDLTGNVSGICPECGTAVPGRASANPNNGVD